MAHSRIMLIVLSLSAFAVSPSALADPERSYQAGRTLADLPPVDDRDAEQRIRDALRDAGARAGQDSGGGSEPSEPRVDPQIEREQRDPQYQ